MVFGISRKLTNHRKRQKTSFSPKTWNSEKSWKQRKTSFFMKYWILQKTKKWQTNSCPSFVKIFYTAPFVMSPLSSWCGECVNHMAWIDVLKPRFKNMRTYTTTSVIFRWGHQNYRPRSSYKHVGLIGLQFQQPWRNKEKWTKGACCFASMYRFKFVEVDCKEQTLFSLGVWVSGSVSWKSKENPKMATKVTRLLSLKCRGAGAKSSACLVLFHV